MAFNQEEFNQFVLDNNIIGFFEKPIKLKSGRMSNWYVNWRNVVEDVFGTDKLTNFILAFAEQKGLNVDCFYGVPEGATKTAVLTTFKLAQQSSGFAPGSHALPMGRAKPKEHGNPKDRYFVGAPRGNTVVIEDVTTTGGSLLTTLKALKEAGITVVAAIGLTNRMEKRDDGKSVAEAVQEQGVPYIHMSSALDLLPQAVAKYTPSEAILQHVEKEFDNVGVEKIKLQR